MEDVLTGLVPGTIIDFVGVVAVAEVIERLDSRRVGAKLETDPGGRPAEGPEVFQLASGVPGGDRAPQRLDPFCRFGAESPRGAGEAVTKIQVDVGCIAEHRRRHRPVAVAARLDPRRVLHRDGVGPHVVPHVGARAAVTFNVPASRQMSVPPLFESSTVSSPPPAITRTVIGPPAGPDRSTRSSPPCR